MTAELSGSLRHVFGVPVVLALVSLVGLISPLVGDGMWNALSWMAGGAPLVVMAWAIRGNGR